IIAVELAGRHANPSGEAGIVAEEVAHQGGAGRLAVVIQKVELRGIDDAHARTNVAGAGSRSDARVAAQALSSDIYPAVEVRRVSVELADQGRISNLTVGL